MAASLRGRARRRRRSHVASGAGDVSDGRRSIRQDGAAGAATPRTVYQACRRKRRRASSVRAAVRTAQPMRPAWNAGPISARRIARRAWLPPGSRPVGDSLWRSGRAGKPWRLDRGAARTAGEMASMGQMGARHPFACGRPPCREACIRHGTRRCRTHEPAGLGTNPGLCGLSLPRVVAPGRRSASARMGPWRVPVGFRGAGCGARFTTVRRVGLAAHAGGGARRIRCRVGNNVGAVPGAGVRSAGVLGPS